jgi:hypothetical protein
MFVALAHDVRDAIAAVSVLLNRGYDRQINAGVNPRLMKRGGSRPELLRFAAKVGRSSSET